MSLNLLVLRCKNIEASKEFYSYFNFSFNEEQHCKSPRHYAATNNNFVFELYPIDKTEYPDNCRLGFTVQNLDLLFSTFKNKCWIEKALFTRNAQKLFIAKDPDGRKVEISEKK